MSFITSNQPAFKRRGIPAAAGTACRVLALAALLGMAGCAGRTFQHGYVASDAALEQIQIGSSRDQVKLILGTPTMTGAVEQDAFYYISERREATLFLAPETVDRRVLAIYFSEDARVTRMAYYGLQDGVVFDFISRETPTRGKETDFISSVLGAAANVSPF